jgi:hypothetical protein
MDYDELERLGITKEQAIEIQKTGLDIEFFINTIKKDRIVKRQLKIDNLKNNIDKKNNK